MHHDSRRGIDRKRRSVHDTVICLDIFDPELSQINGLSEFDHLTLCDLEQIMLLQLILNNAHRQLGRIDRDIQLLEHIGQRTDMILMSVRDHKGLYLVLILLQISNIGNDHIDS